MPKPVTKWTDERVRQVVSLRADGKSWPEVAKIMGDSISAMQTAIGRKQELTETVRAEKQSRENPNKRYYRCAFNPIGVLCDKYTPNCYRCGWNPEEYERRLKRIMVDKSYIKPNEPLTDEEQMELLEEQHQHDVTPTK